MKADIERGIRESIRVKEQLLERLDLLDTMGKILYDCIRGGGKAIFFGNGGSAADAQHLAAELVGRFCRERRALAAYLASLGDAEESPSESAFSEGIPQP